MIFLIVIMILLLLLLLGILIKLMVVLLVTSLAAAQVSDTGSCIPTMRRMPQPPGSTERVPR